MAFLLGSCDNAYGVDIQCSGSVGLTGAGALDYQGLANILTKQGFLTNIVARMSGATLVNGKLFFPISDRGNPTPPNFPWPIKRRKQREIATGELATATFRVGAALERVFSMMIAGRTCERP